MHGSSRFNEFASPKLSIAQVVEDLTVKVVRSSDLFIIMQNSLPQIAAVLLLVLLLPTQSSVGQECGQKYGQEAQKKTVKTPPLSKPVPATIATEFSLSDFYQKCIVVGGLPIVASRRVADAALLETAFVVRSMLKERPDILRQLAINRIRLAVMATSERTCDIPEHSDLKPQEYWNRRARGLGATRHRPCVSCAEENVLNLKGDPYDQECILIHEFSHAIHLMALVDLDPTFQKRLQACYASAIENDLWKGTYAASNVEEYWAEGVQSWFDCNQQNDAAHNHVNTRKELRNYDPDLHSLVKSVFRDESYRYSRSDSEDRTELHLRDLDRNKFEPFRWAEEEQRR